MEETKTHSKYYPEINYLRGFAILAVISIHVSGVFTKMQMSSMTMIYMFIDAISQFAVPAFIFISGFVLYNKYNSDFDLKQFYLKRYKTIIPPYLIFSTFYILVKIPVAKMIHRTIDTNILHMYLTGSSLFHMWFFTLIIQLYILYPLILKIYNYSNRWSLILAFIASVVLSKYEVAGYMFYFVLGMYLNNHYNNPISTKHIFVIPALIAGTAIQVMYYMDTYFSNQLLINFPEQLINIVSILYFTVGFLVLLEIAKTLSRSEKLQSIDYLGSNSFSIYLIHALFIYIFTLLFPKIGFEFNNILFYPVVFILTLGFSLVSIKIIKLMPGSEYTLGTSKTKKRSLY
ncbi:MAG: acyltransferase [Parabacteroides sp.]